MGRVPRAIGRGGKTFWRGLDTSARRRGAIALGLIVAAVLVLAVVVPALPCEFPGGDECAPQDDAIALAPADALAYLHVNVDPSTDQYENASSVASRLRLITDQVTTRLLARLPSPRGGPPDFRRDIDPWFGGEAALAVVPAGAGQAQEVQLLEASDADGATSYAEDIATGKTTTSDYDGIEITTDRRGLSTALLGGFLAIGREDGVRAVIDAQTESNGESSLAGSSEADAARDALPDFRLADAYLSRDGIRRLVATGGVLEQFGPLVNPGASTGVAVGLVASDEGFELDVRSAIDPQRAKARPGFFSALPPFEPTLASRLSDRSLAYLGIGNPGEALSSLLQQARAEAPALAQAFSGFDRRLRALGDVDLQKDLLPSLGDEAAIALQPGPEDTEESGKAEHKGSGKGKKEAKPQAKEGKSQAQKDFPLQPPPAEAPEAKTPFLEFVGTGVDEERAKKALAKLQGPIARALNPATGGQAPVFKQSQIADVQAQSLRLSPAVDLTYALFESLLVVATDPTGVDQVASGEGGLDASDGYTSATSGFSESPSLLVYLNLSGLVALAEQAGLGEDPAYATFADEVHKLEAVGVSVASDSSHLDTDVRLIVGTAESESAPSGITAPAGD